MKHSLVSNINNNHNNNNNDDDDDDDDNNKIIKLYLFHIISKNTHIKKRN